MATVSGSLNGNSVVSTSEKGRFITHTSYGVQATVTGTVITIYYKKIARDSGSVSPQFVVWSTVDKDGAYPDPPPFGGPLVDECIISILEVYE